MNLSEDRLTFRPRKSRSNPYRMLLWTILIVAGLWLVVQLERGEGKGLFDAPPTPTRTAFSYAQEGQAHFEAGNLTKAIEAYEEALRHNPDDAQLGAKLAQVQVYSSALLTTDVERLQRLQDAKASIDKAVALAEDDSSVRAIRAFVLDWHANPNLVSAEEREDLLFEASNEAAAAINLDTQNALALAYLAEVQLDLQQWFQAQDTIEQALVSNPNLMDVHRIRGQVLETLGDYRGAIDAYEEAAKIAPNMTFLYLYIGYNYRQLQIYNWALEYFARAARINKQIQVEDPLPYLAIAKTYTQQGEFFIAARNAEKALEFSPQNANTYGQLGTIYIQARNYESAVPVLKCAVYGCSAEDNQAAQEIMGQGVEVQGLPLTSIEVAYYYVRYGSVLAALNRCDEAEPVLEEVMISYGSDPVIASIVAEDREICRILAEDSR